VEIRTSIENISLKILKKLIKFGLISSGLSSHMIFLSAISVYLIFVYRFEVINPIQALEFVMRLNLFAVCFRSVYFFFV